MLIACWRNSLNLESHSRLDVVIIPPSPVLMTLRGWNEKQAISACGLPIFSHLPFHWISLPIAHAASSTTGSEWRRATSRIAAKSQGIPI